LFKGKQETSAEGRSVASGHLLVIYSPTHLSCPVCLCCSQMKAERQLTIVDRPLWNTSTTHFYTRTSLQYWVCSHAAWYVYNIHFVYM